MYKTSLLTKSLRRDRFRFQNHTRLIGIAILISILIAACGSQPTETVEAETQEKAELHTEFPIGEFHSRSQSITFQSGGTFFVKYLSDIETILLNGSYSIDGNQITLQDDACVGIEAGVEPGEVVVAIYTWEFDGETLDLGLVDDKCLPRRQEFLRSFVLQP